MKTILAIIGAITLLLVFGLFAVCNDDDDEVDSFGPVVLVSHDYDYGDDNGQEYDQNYGSRDDRNRNRNRERGAFSPGPFDRSPIDFSGSCISLNCSGREEDRDREPSESGPTDPR